MLTDTHAHLDFPDFDPDRSEVIQRAHDAQVDTIISIGTQLETSRAALALARDFPRVFATVGIHPNEADAASGPWIASLRELARQPKVAALGEIGLDFHRLPSAALRNDASVAFQASDAGTLTGAVEDGAYKLHQGEVFRSQLDLAVELGFNVVIHQRDAWEETLAILEPYSGKLRAVFHCFAGTPEQAHHLIGLGHLVSFTGILTFKSAASLRDTVAAVPAGSWMIETDCPYLAPVPHRGKRCEPAHVREIAEAVAACRHTSWEDVARESSATARSFFRLTSA